MVVAIDDLIIASVAVTAVGEIIGGPLKSILSDVFPHDDVSTRMVLNAYLAGGLTEELLSQTKAWQDLNPTDKQVILQYKQRLDAAREVEKEGKLLAANAQNAKREEDKLTTEQDHLVTAQLDDVEREARSLRKSIVDNYEAEVDEAINRQVKARERFLRKLEGQVPGITVVL